METKQNNKKVLVGATVLIVVLLILVGAYLLFVPKAVEGAKAITLEVIDNEAASITYTVNTDAQYLSEVMEEATSQGFSYEGEMGDWGFTIYTINNVTADFNVDGAYWSIMVNGEYGQYGADTQVVADGDTFEFIYTVFSE